MSAEGLPVPTRGMVSGVAFLHNGVEDLWSTVTRGQSCQDRDSRAMNHVMVGRMSDAC